MSGPPLWRVLSIRPRLACGILSSGGVGFEDAADFVADLAEDLKDLFLSALGVGGVQEAPVVTVYLAGKDGAGLVGMAADGDDGFDFLAQKFIQMFRAMVRDINPHLLHDTDGQGMHIAGRFGAGALDIENITGGGAQKAFRQVAATGVAGAEDQNDGLGIRHR